MVSQEVDHLPGLAGRLAADVTVVAAPEGHVLPEQHPGPVGRLIEGGCRDVAGHSHQVQAGGGGPLEVGFSPLGGYRDQAASQRGHDGTPEEQPFAVYPPDVVTHSDRAEAHRADRSVAHEAVDGGHVEG